MKSNKEESKLPALKSLLKELGTNSDIHVNVDQQYIITTEDKIKIALSELVNRLEKKGRWKTPFAILITIVTALLSTNFKGFLFSAIIWQTIFIFVAILSFCWIIYALWKSRRQIGIEDVIAELKRGSPMKSESLTVTSLGKKDSFLLFTDGYIEVPHRPELEPEDLTVEAWIYPFGEGERNGTIVRKAAHNAPGYILRWRQADQTVVQFRIDRQNAPTIMTEGPPFKSLIRKWSHLAGTFNSESNVASLFVNGKRTSTVHGKSKASYKSGDRLTIGGSPNAEHESFYGIIRSIRISSTVRYHEDFAPPQQGEEVSLDSATILYMPLEEGVGKEVCDLVTNNKFSVHGTKWITESEIPNT